MGVIRLPRLPRRLEERRKDVDSEAVTAVKAVKRMTTRQQTTARQRVAVWPRLSRLIQPLNLLYPLVRIEGRIRIMDRAMASLIRRPAALDPSPRRVAVDRAEAQEKSRYWIRSDPWNLVV